MTQPKSHNENPRRRTTTRLSATLDKGLVAYVAAAGAGMLAAQPAQGEVVYTPANTPIAVNTPLALDLNNDGIADFVLSNNSVAGWARPESCYTHCSYRRHESLKVSPAQAGNAIWGIASSLLARPTRLQKKIKRSTNKEVAAPLFWGVDAGSGPGRNFRPQTVMMDSNIYTWSFPGRLSTRTYWPWGRGRPIAGPYLGFKFTVDGEIHYGWARVVVQATPQSITATLTGYAYETIPNRGILTGFTRGTLDDSAEADASAQAAQAAPSATLGQLAQGARGVLAWRATQR